MKRIFISLLILCVSAMAFAQVSGSTAFGAVYDIAGGKPYWGVQPSATLTLGKDTLKALVEIGSYDVVDDVTLTESVVTAGVAAAVLQPNYPVNAVLTLTIKDISNLTLTLAGTVNDIIDAPAWNIVPSASYVLGFFTPAVSVTVDKAFLFPSTWTLGFAPFKFLSMTATVAQSGIAKIPETVKLSGTFTY